MSYYYNYPVRRRRKNRGPAIVFLLTVACAALLGFAYGAGRF